ncbi:type II toxin-antitoxin system antitoxin SocA domain-containing protein [Spirosoma areae]
MNSPITDKPMVLKVKTKTLPFRKELFTVEYQYYLCEDSGEEFITPEIGDANLSQVYNSYRIKHQIPFPDEIKKIRNLYGLSAVKMSEILGFGVNMYRNYEAGEMPNDSNARFIKTASNPESFRDIVSYSSALSGKDLERLNERIAEIIEDREASIISKDEYIMDGKVASEYTGYKVPDLNKALNVVVYFAETLKPWQTALNKLLFYADFGHCKATGQSITGLSYRAITYGVVPRSYDKLFAEAADQNLVKVNYYMFENSANVSQQYTSISEFNSEIFSESELGTLKKISEKFSNYSASDIVKANHEEKAWLDNVMNRDLVSYKESFHLQHI